MTDRLIRGALKSNCKCHTGPGKLASMFWWLHSVDLSGFNDPLP